MLWSIDTCQNKVSADQYYVTLSWAQVYNSRYKTQNKIIPFPGLV